MSTILPPRLARKPPDGDPIECSLHTLPKPLLREFHHVFQEKHLSMNSEGVLLAIPTNQHAQCDLVAVGDHVEAEKDRLLNVVCYNCYGLHILC